MQRRNVIPFAILLVIFTLFILTGEVWACPDVEGLADLNCDGKVTITLFGDSITKGTKDSSGLGYPGRLRRLIPLASTGNFGNPGERTGAGRSRALGVFTGARATDYGVILEGVNDYFENISSSTTRNNLFSMLTNARNSGGVISLATLVDNRRDYQRPWVFSVNNQIRSQTSVDFFSLGQGILSSDGLHPGNSGYQRMAEYVLPLLRSQSDANRPADADSDGIYDFAESRFGAQIGNADTDGDGLLDGAEVFTYKSNPNALDSDGDGFTDPFEVNTLHSDPANPLPGSPTITSIEIVPQI